MGNEPLTSTVAPFDNYLPLAMAYVPPQSFSDIYDPETALERGTIFKKLDLPYLGRKVAD